MFSVDFTFIWTIINLLILFIVLKKFLFGRIANFMEKRAKNIAEQHDRAERELSEAKALRQSYDDKLKTAEAEAGAILKQARSAAEYEAEKILTQANEQAEHIVEAGRKQLISEQQAAFLAFKSQAAALTLAAASRILRREINSDDDKRFAERVLREIEEAGRR